MENTDEFTKYELMLIFSPDLSEKEFEEELEEVKKLLLSIKAEIYHEENWGMRDFAYRIKKHEQGIYVILNFNAEAAKVKELDDSLNIQKGLIRYLLIKTPHEYEIKTIKEYEEEAEKEKKESKKKKAEESEREKPSRKREKPEKTEEKEDKKIQEEPKQEEPEKEVEKTEEKVDVEETQKPEKTEKEEKESKDKLSEVDEKLKNLINDPDISL